MPSAPTRVAGAAAWPALPFAEWQDTYRTLHMWTQIVGRTRLALASMENHWWQVALYVTPRGLTTSAMPSGTRTFAVDFDFLDHQLYLQASDGVTRALPLVPQSVADFYAAYMDALRSLGLEVNIRPTPVEVETAIPFGADTVHASYDADAANRCWRLLVQADRVLKRFRGRFLGKASPVHFFWGSFDLAATLCRSTRRTRESVAATSGILTARQRSDCQHGRVRTADADHRGRRRLYCCCRGSAGGVGCEVEQVGKLRHLSEQRTAASGIQRVKPQHRVTRTRVKDSKLLELRRLRRPLWIRRVLVRAQEGQCQREEAWAFLGGSSFARSGSSPRGAMAA